MERAHAGTPTRARLRAAALAGLATAAVTLAAAAALSPAAQARPRVVCCFRVTVNIDGKVQGDYTKVDRTDSQGRYYYNWDGTGYGIAHLKSSILETDRGVATAFFGEVNEVTDF